jgi:hypothetical protein
MSNLMLVSMVDKIEEVQPAAMYEREAAHYLKLSVNDLRAFAKSGLVVARRHPNRSRCIYLKADLDRYLESLKQEVVA